MQSEYAAADEKKEKSSAGPKKKYGIRDVFYDLNGIITIFLFALNTIFHFPFLITAILFKLIPLKFTRKLATRTLTLIVETWIGLNSFILDITKSIKWNVEGLENLSKDKWYLVLSNHQSWSDILILQKLLNRKIPMLKFFIKQELIWVPIMGLAWWALDYPFMKRYTKEEIAKKPHLAGNDIEATRKACEKFKDIPVAVMNFVEGSRYTEKKKVQRKSQYRNLLNPRAGGTGFVLSSMGHLLTDILDITIKYENDKRGFWQFLSGRIKEITIKVETIPVTEDLVGDYHNDSEYREYFINWINELWQKKDNLLEEMK